MSNTYTQLHVQVVFAVYGRANVIQERHRDQVEKFITGIIKNRKCKPLAIYCNPDHIHILFGLHPSVSVSDFCRDVKASSSKYINDNKLIKGKFSWQSGYGAFSYSKSHVEKVIKYILNQPEHHKTKSFKGEYLGMLKNHEMEYEEPYLFEFYENMSTANA